MSALEEVLSRFGAPRISNTDQGSRFTSEAYLRPLREAGVRISMDERGRWIDNRFIEQLWCSLKYEAVYLVELTGGHHGGRGIRRRARCLGKAGKSRIDEGYNQPEDYCDLEFTVTPMGTTADVRIIECTDAKYEKAAAKT